MERSALAGKSLTATGIRVSYGPREVLHGVDLRLEPGEVHALLGANGSGKSTLVKVLTGRIPANAGALKVGSGESLTIRSPGDAYAVGIRAVQQETPLIDAMSITENIALRLGYPKGRFGRIKWGLARQRAETILDTLGLSADPMARAATLPAADRGLLTIGIALDEGPDGAGESGKILVLDEATAAVPEKDAIEVLKKVRELADRGLAVLMVTHRISEATAFADRMTVIYDGNVAYEGSARIDPEQIIELIVTGRTGGRAELETTEARRPTEAAGPGVRVEGLRGTAIDEISFEIAPGEILGLVGGPQSGASEIAAALAGLMPRASGYVTVGGARGRLPRDPREAKRRGICLVPRDRLRQGGIGPLSIFENVLLPNARGFLYNTARHRALVDSVINEFAVMPPDANLRFRELSGGNQQKVIVGKWLSRRPELLILDDPTIGVDPGARRIMFNAVAERCRTDGLSVLLLSSEPEELARHCHRLLAVEDGRIAQELTGDRLDALAVSALASR